MPKRENFWNAVSVFFVTVAYLPIIIGGWIHPAEINIATYGLWTMLFILYGYSSWKLKKPDLPLVLCCIVGDLLVTVLGLAAGGAFVLGKVEGVGIIGLALTVGSFLVYGMIRKLDDRIIAWGVIVTDVVSFYPMAKQYLWMKHEPMSAFGLAGWWCFLLGALAMLFGSQRFVEKIVTRSSRLPATLEQSALALEQVLFQSGMIYIMYNY